MASVDLPAPVAPTRARCSPGATVSETPATAGGLSPYPKVTASARNSPLAGSEPVPPTTVAGSASSEEIFASAARPDWNSLYQSPRRATGSKSEIRYSAKATTVPTVTRPCRSR